MQLRKSPPYVYCFTHSRGCTGTSPESSPTKDSVEGGVEDEAAKAADLEEKRRKKDEELRAKGATMRTRARTQIRHAERSPQLLTTFERAVATADPVAYETRKRLEARLSIDSRLAGV